jgi:hypothetical protein
MEIAKLKNGKEEAGPLVAVVMVTLGRLFDEEPITAFELVTLARDPSHVLWPGTPEKLAALGLVEHGRIQNSIRNVILSAVTGEGLDMVLSDPRAP